MRHHNIRSIVLSLALLSASRAATADLLTCQNQNSAPETIISICSADIKRIRSPIELALAFYYRGAAHRRINEFDHAIDDLTAAIRLQPTWMPALALRGLAYEQKSDHASARKDYDAILAEPVSAGDRAGNQWPRQIALEHLPKLVVPTKPAPVTTASVANGSDGARTPISSGPASSAANLTKPLKQQIEACGARAMEVAGLPTALGDDVRFSKCFRGRAHLVCVAGAILAESMAIQKEYADVVAADYPNKKDAAALCSISPDQLGQHFTKVKTAEERLKFLRSEYEGLLTCTKQLDDTLSKVSIANMSQGADVLRTLRESVRADFNDVSVAQRSVLNLAGNLATAGKAMTTIEKFQKGGLCRSN